MAELVQMGVIVAGLLLAAIGMVWLWRTSARPSIIERLERSMVSNQTRLDTQEGEIDDLRRQIVELREGRIADHASVSYTHLRAHETVLDLVCRLLLEKKKTSRALSIEDYSNLSLDKSAVRTIVA